MKSIWLRILTTFGLVLGLFWMSSFESPQRSLNKTKTNLREIPGIKKEAFRDQSPQNEGNVQKPKTDSAQKGLLAINPSSRELTRESVKAFLEDPNLIPAQVSFQQGPERFTSLPGLYAISNQDLKDSEGYEIIGSFLGLSVVQTDNPELTEKSYRLVVEKERGALALVTGNLKVAHSDSLKAKQIEEAFGLKLLESFPSIGMSIFSTQAQDLKGLLQIADSVRASSGVERVTLDLIDRLRKPQ